MPDLRFLSVLVLVARAFTRQRQHRIWFKIVSAFKFVSLPTVLVSAYNQQ